MTKFIGRQVNVGIGKESVRGTAVAPTYWVPKMELSHDDKIQQVVNENSMGIIEDSTDASVVQKFSEGEIKGRALDDSLGLFLMATIGSDVATVVGGETLVYDHVFSVLQSAQHPSLTIAVKEPNNANGLRYTLAMIDSLELNAELNKFVEIKAKYRANSNATGTLLTPSYPTTSNFFLPQHGVIKVATNQAGLAGASAINIKRATLSVKKNIEDDQVIGNIGVTDRLNKQLEIEGSIEIMYDDRTYVDTMMLGDLQKALRISFINTDKVIGNTSNPTLTIDLHKVKFSEVGLKLDNGDFVTQTLNFKAFYNTTDSKMITTTLRNLVATAY